MIERQTIPHLNALIDGSKILGEQLSSSFRGCHTTSSLKIVFFTRKVVWSSLIKLHSCSWHILMLTSRAKKWGIICLCSLGVVHKLRGQNFAVFWPCIYVWWTFVDISFTMYVLSTWSFQDFIPSPWCYWYVPRLIEYELMISNFGKIYFNHFISISYFTNSIN